MPVNDARDHGKLSTHNCPDCMINKEGLTEDICSKCQRTTTKISITPYQPCQPYQPYQYTYTVWSPSSDPCAACPNRDRSACCCSLPPGPTATCSAKAE